MRSIVLVISLLTAGSAAAIELEVRGKSPEATVAKQPEASVRVVRAGGQVAGATLALDFPNNGHDTLKLLDELDEVTREAGGRVNPSKDARMKAADFQAQYSNWPQLEAHRDPGICSSFWRRVTTDS